nr:hypothetical protein [Tanacetum cinerariifolium]
AKNDEFIKTMDENMQKIIKEKVKEQVKADELYRDVNINLGRGIQLGDVHTTQEVKDSHVTQTLVNPDGQQQSSFVSSQFVTTPSTLLQDLPNFGSLFGFDNQLKTLEANFFEFMQMNQFAEAVSSIPEIAKNDEFIKTIDENMQKIIKEKVKEQVKALIEAYESDKIILDTYGETVMLKRRCDDDADKDEEPSDGSDRGSKRCRDGKEPESASAPKEKATRSAGKSGAYADHL